MFFICSRDELPGMATKVKLTYQMFQIEEEPTCKYDYLEVNSMASGLVGEREISSKNIYND